MISNTELKKQLKNDRLNLDDNQFNLIRTLLLQLATLEYDNYRLKKSKVKNCKSNIIIQLSRYPNQSHLKIA
jgi:hypothetical protein